MTTKYNRGRYGASPYDDLRTSESPWSWGSLLLTALVLSFLCGAFLLASAADEKAEADHNRLTKAEQVSQALPTKLAEAYERGMADAMESINGTPQGVALAQACLASGVRR